MTKMCSAARRIWSLNVDCAIRTTVERRVPGTLQSWNSQAQRVEDRLYTASQTCNVSAQVRSRAFHHGGSLRVLTPQYGHNVPANLFPYSTSLLISFRLSSLSGFSATCFNGGGNLDMWPCCINKSGLRTGHDVFQGNSKVEEAWYCESLSRLQTRYYSSTYSTNENDSNKSPLNSNVVVGEDELSMTKRAKQLKAEFEAAQKVFLKIPEEIHAIPKMNPNGVYANYNLRLDQIKVYGFDYDYTLAHYTSALQTLIYDLAKKHLVKEYRYPETCLEFKYDPQFSIRGLYYDKKNGNLLKLDFFHSVEPHGCFYGRRRLSRVEIEEQYGGKHISVSDIPNLVALMDLFCLSEACLISDVIQHFVDQNMDFDSAYVYDDVKRSINYVHRSGLMHRAVLADPAKFLVKNDAVVQMLKTLKQRGKKLFILTNSPFPFVNGGMKFLFQEDGQCGETWHELFDVVVALADKPTFYTSERPFRHYNTKTDMLAFNRVDQFREHGVYYHGCLKTFLEITKWRGSEVLYCGDHLYTDLRGPAKAGWRTAAIIRELEKEIMTQNQNEYRFQQAKYNVIQELLGKFHKIFPEISHQGEDEQILLAGLRREREDSRVAMRQLFNYYFGSCFLTDTGKESAFAYNVQRYADIYTSRLENLVAQSCEPWIYTPFDLKSLPHHIKVSPSSILKLAK